MMWRALLLALVVSIFGAEPASAAWTGYNQSHPTPQAACLQISQDAPFAGSPKQLFGMHIANKGSYICEYQRYNHYWEDATVALCSGSYFVWLLSLDGCLDYAPAEKTQGPPATCAGNPIDVATGNKYQAFTDFESATPDKLAFARHYNATKFYSSPGLPPGWTTNFGAWITFDGLSTPLRLWTTRATGQVMLFTRNSVGGYYADSDVTLRVANTTGTTWTVTDDNDTVETYTKVSGTNGRLMSIRAKNGYLQTLSYNAGGQLTGVTDSYGRQLSFTYTSRGFLQTMTDPASRIYTYSYTPQSAAPGGERMTEVVYPDDTPANPADDPKVQYHYEDARFPFALTGLTDENGIRFATWTYDAKLRATSSEHAGGAEHVDIVYNADGSRTVTNALGKQAIYRFTTLQGIPKLTKIDGQASANCPAASAELAYNTGGYAGGYVSSRKDWKGNQTTYVRDARGLETSRTEAATTALARTITTTWHATFRVPTQIIAPGKTTTFTYDTNGLVLTRTETDTTTHTVPYSTNGRTRTWTYTYTAAGLLASVDGPRTDVTDLTSFGYDAVGNLTSVTNSLSQVTNIIAHDARGLPLTVVDANGVTTALTYNARGWLLSRTVQDVSGNAVTSFEYDAVGNITKITLPNAAELNYTYDNAHRLTRVSNNTGERIDYTLDALGGRTVEEIRDASATLVKTQTRVFDELGRLLRGLGAASQTTIYAYDNSGNQISVTDPLTRVTGQAFDALNRLITVTDAASGQTGTGYDNRDNLTSVTDPRGLVTAYVYDGFGNVIQTASPDTGVTVYEVDRAGNRTKQTDARGVVADFTYDALNRVTAKTFPAASAENVAYLYDQAAAQHGVGRLTGFTDASGGMAYVYDHRGNVVQETRTIGATSYVTAYAYDLADNLTQITYPSGRIVAYARDSLGRVSGVTTKANALASPVTVASNVTWMPFGPLKGLTYGNGLDLALSYDQDYRLTALSTAAGAMIVQSLSYGYDSVGNITSITDSVNAARSQTYGYDNLYRLTSATGIYGTLGYSYDAVGNRLTRTRSGGAGALSETYSYAANSNRLLSVANGSTTRNFSYSAAGNISLDDRGVGQDYGLVYSNDNRLAELTQASQSKATYANSDSGERVRKTLPGSPATTTHYLYDQDGALIDEDDGTGTAQREYIHLAGLPLALIAGSQLAFVHMDHLGTPQAMTDGTQAHVWDVALRPFGAPESQTGTLLNPQRFPGQLADDEAGYHDNVWRTYDPTIGRYLQSDPIGLRGGLNTFAYVDGNPIGRTDPQGQNTVVAGAVAGGLLGGPVGAAAGAAIGLGIGIGGGLAFCHYYPDTAYCRPFASPPSAPPQFCPIPPDYGNTILNQDDKPNKPPAAQSPEDKIREGATPGRPTKGPTEQFEKPGGAAQAERDFDSLNPSNIKNRPGGGKIGDLPDGSKVLVRPDSTDGRPTLEIQRGSKYIKYRYNP